VRHDGSTIITVVTFASLVGHRGLVALLSRAVERGSLPPTLLFAGPSGVGKWRTAQATAQALNCERPVRARANPAELGGEAPDHLRRDAGPGDDRRPTAPPYDACGRCRSCSRIARGLHVDVLAVEPDEKASIKIDAVRDVLARTAYRPFEGRRRAVLIREADTLEPASQNALLKSLEEPPPSTVFILTTAAPGALLPTVRSRTMTLRFGRLTPADVARILVRDHGLDEREARTVSGLAEGSVGGALALGSTDVAVLRETALLLLQETAGRPDAQTRLRAASALVSGTTKKERSREELAGVLRLAAAMLRDIEAINSGADRRLLANGVAADELQSLAPRFDGDRARSAFGAVDRALAALDRNAGTKVVAEWLAMQV
jgi:DNA polymerase-3 subunit delta'